MQGAQGRIRYLDGLRGIAILLVVVTHYWGQGWAAILPGVESFGSIRIIRQGWVGVELFFLISGFVILRTIERCSGSPQFIYKRWLRLFPAMLITTVLTVAFNYTIQPIEKFSNSAWYDAIPGLLFISPSFLSVIFQVEIESLHHAFATLYIEVGFYIIFTCLYFRSNWKWATSGLAILGFTILFGRPILASLNISGVLVRVVEPFEWVGMPYYLWFTSGILFAKAESSTNNGLFSLACSFGLCGALLVGSAGSLPRWDDSEAMMAVVVVFAVAQKWKWLQKRLGWQPLLFFGAISYPLYLVHETIGLGLIVLTHQIVSGIPDALLPVPTCIIVIAIAWWITNLAEPKLKAAFEQVHHKLKSPRLFASESVIPREDG